MTTRVAVAGRFVAFVGLATGLGASPLVSAAPGGLAAGAVAVLALLLFAPRSLRGFSLGACAWLALLAAAAATAGLGLGALRLRAIDAGALDLAPGTRATVRGFVAAVPRRTDGEVRVRVDTPDGRLLVTAPEPVADLDVGTALEATGAIREPAPFERDYLARLGIRRILAADAILPRAERRGGVAGLLDRVRVRAQDALSTGTPAASAALLRGFVLGQDDGIDTATVEDFKRSGLAHLLAVSGMNVVLLAVLASALLSLAGVSIRSRLLAIAALIVVYVLLAGAGPSIQRAGAMGMAGVVAALAGRPRSRWYALLLASAVTLALNPRAAADVGWQLSFAAVAGIMLLCAPLARALAGSRPGRWRSGLGEAAALTISATLATAPLISLHFGVVSVASLPANLVAVVAEAPVMWLGMLAAAAGQVTWLPVEPVTWLAGLLAAYIAQVAAWFASPGWAQVGARLHGAGALAASYAMLAAGALVAVRWSARRRGLGPRGLIRRPLIPALAVCGTLIVAAAIPAAERDAPGAGLRVSVLDVGQGDAILLEPRAGRPILVDAGPPGARVAARLRQRGIGRLGALFVTHPDSDHAGGAADVLGSVGADHLLYARASPETLAAAAAAGIEAERVAEGFVLRSGGLRLRALWPPAELLGEHRGGAEPNALGLVLIARWHGFRILLTGDAEAELAPVQPGEVDVLKVAHHGSEDPGLTALLGTATPHLAVISAGRDNPYGHPAPATLAALERAGVPVARTDVVGEVTIVVTRRSWTVRPSP